MLYGAGNIDFQGAFSTRTHFSACLHGHMYVHMYVDCCTGLLGQRVQIWRDKHVRNGTRHTYLLIVATVLLPVNINKCVRDAPNNDKSFANAQTGTSANNSFGFNTTQHNTTQLKKSKELEDCHPPQPGGGGGDGGSSS